MTILSRAKAIAGIKIVERLRAGHGQFFQNKRKAHRDLKWDYLADKLAFKISRALKRAGVAHKAEWIERPFYGSHSQIRLAVPLDFSLLEVRGRRLDQAKRRKERAKMKRFYDKVRRAEKLLDALRHDRRGDGMKLTRTMRALRGRK